MEGVALAALLSLACGASPNLKAAQEAWDKVVRFGIGDDSKARDCFRQRDYKGNLHTYEAKAAGVERLKKENPSPTAQADIDKLNQLRKERNTAETNWKNAVVECGPLEPSTKSVKVERGLMQYMDVCQACADGPTCMKNVERNFKQYEDGLRTGAKAPPTFVCR